MLFGFVKIGHLAKFCQKKYNARILLLGFIFSRTYIYVSKIARFYSYLKITFSLESFFVNTYLGSCECHYMMHALMSCHKYCLVSEASYIQPLGSTSLPAILYMNFIELYYLIILCLGLLETLNCNLPQCNSKCGMLNLPKF